MSLIALNTRKKRLNVLIQIKMLLTYKDKSEFCKEFKVFFILGNNKQIKQTYYNFFKLVFHINNI